MDTIINTPEYARNLIEASLDPLVTINADGKIMDVNEAMAKITDKKREKLIGTDFKDYFTDPEKAREVYQEVFAKGFVANYPLTIIDGILTHVLFNGSVFKNKQGKVIGAVVVARDVTEIKRLQKAFDIERQQFFDLFSEAPFSLGVLSGSDHRFEMANPMYLQLIGKKDIIGKPVKDVLPEVEVQGFIEILDSVYQTGKTFTANEMIVKLDVNNTGKPVDKYLNFIYQPHIGSAGKPDGILFFTVDVTEQVMSRKKIEESEKEVRAIAESMPQIVWVTDGQGQNTYCNQQWVDYTGLTLLESLGSGWLIPFHEDDKSLAWTEWNKAVNTLSEYAIECRLRKYDGSYTWWLIRGVPKINEKREILKWYGTCTEIEKIKQTEKRLKNQTNELENSNAELEQFAYITSHDLQEPLRMITSFMDQLKRKYIGQLDDKAHQYIEFAIDGAKRMKHIILDILEYSRAGKIKEELQNIDLKQILDEYKILRRKIIAEKKALFQVGNLPIITTYNTPFIQVVHNLIDNAIKYAKNDENPVVKISCIDRNQFWEFCIEDNGIGIDEKFFTKIFVIFQRLHDRDNYSGTGIGLSIVKKQLESLGGKIWIVSKLNVGSKFYFTIPKLKT